MKVNRSKGLKRKYSRMRRTKLNELAIAGDQEAIEALVVHQTLDRLIEQTEDLQRRVTYLSSKP